MAFLPLACLLWIAQADTPAPPEGMPSKAPASGENALDLDGSGFIGRVVQLEGMNIRLIHEDKIRCYAKLGELVRHEGKPRVKDVLIALFQDNRLRMTIKSPYAEGDPADFLSEKTGSRIVSFGGGVVVRDPQGRERARVNRLTLDLDKLTLQSADRVSMRIADDAELSADGFFADLSKELRSARVGGNVTLSAPTGGDIATLRCKGPATLTEQAEGEYLVTLMNEAAIEHPLASATCDKIVALLRKRGTRMELVSAVLSGNVAIDLEANRSGGLESVNAPIVVLEGDSRIQLRDFSAVRRGKVPALGPEDRTIDLKAKSAALTLNRVDDHTLKVWEVSLKGDVEARDRNGPAYLKTQSLLFNDSTRLFEASGGVEAKTAAGFVRAQRLRVIGVADGEYDLLLEGVGKRLEYTVDGKLGPLGEGRRGKLVVTSDGPLRADVRRLSKLFRASGAVRVDLAGDTHLKCGRLSLYVYERDLRWIEARDRVVLVEGGRGAELRGDALLYRGDSALLRGSPALVISEAGSVRARTIAYEDGGAFVARDAVAISATLDRGEGKEQWRIYCREAHGVLRKEGPPESLEALGTVIAMGPENQHFSGSLLRFDGTLGEAVLRGDPALVQRGKELRFEALQIDLKFKDKRLASAETAWPADVVLRRTPKKAGGKTFAQWTLRLKKGARFAGNRLVAPGGATFQAFDEKGVRQASGRVGHATVFLVKDKETWRATRLLCTKGIRAFLHGKDKAQVDAARLVYSVGKREIDLRGGARVKAKGWSPQATFEHLIFALTEDGVDLKRASDVSIRDPRR